MSEQVNIKPLSKIKSFRGTVDDAGKVIELKLPCEQIEITVDTEGVEVYVSLAGMPTAPAAAGDEMVPTPKIIKAADGSWRENVEAKSIYLIAESGKTAVVRVDVGFQFGATGRG